MINSIADSIWTFISLDKQHLQSGSFIKSKGVSLNSTVETTFH